MAAPGTYPDEVRERTNRLVRDLGDSGADGVTSIGAGGSGRSSASLPTRCKGGALARLYSSNGGEGGSERTRLAELRRAARF
jgi:hypothetical protein